MGSRARAAPERRRDSRLASLATQNGALAFYTLGGARPGGVLPYKSLMGMCRWMGSHFHDWSDYNGVAFSIELLEWGRKFSNFGGK